MMLDLEKLNEIERLAVTRIVRDRLEADKVMINIHVITSEAIRQNATAEKALIARAEKAEAEIHSLECVASGYGISVNTMLELGKSYVKMAQDNICLIEDIQRIMAERDAAVGIGDSMCEELENCYGRETELTERWHGKGV